MRLPRFRLKLWMLVVLVALIAMGIAAARTIRRVSRHKEMAAICARNEAICRGGLADGERRLTEWQAYLAKDERELAEYRKSGDRGWAKYYEGEVGQDRRWIRHIRDAINYWHLAADLEARMRRKHERACRFPWPRVEPDPPAPDWMLRFPEAPLRVNNPLPAPVPAPPMPTPPDIPDRPGPERSPFDLPMPTRERSKP